MNGHITVFYKNSELVNKKPELSGNALIDSTD